MTDMFTDLPAEILLHIFKHCTVVDLCRLKQTCRIFCTIINTFKIVTGNQHTVATNQIRAAIKNRSILSLDPFQKWQISHNWQIGRYKSVKLLKKKILFMPWLCLDKDYLWVSQGKFIKGFQRNPNKIIDENSPGFILNNGSNEDIVRFKIKGNYLICGLRSGIVWIWSLERENFLLQRLNWHNSNDIHGVDITKNIFVTCSSDRTYSIWPLNLEDIDNSAPLTTTYIGDKILSIGISPFENFLAIGSAGCNGIRPFRIHDLESHVPLLMRQTNVKGAGILDLHWQDENTILTCGYDTYLIKWDLRCGQAVQKWEDPHDSSVYCLASDDLYTILTGVNSYGRAVLWDQRVHKNYIQLYYACNSDLSSRSSPVYSIDFDATQLFLALDRNVTCFDFSKSHGERKNYRFAYY